LPILSATRSTLAAKQWHLTLIVSNRGRLAQGAEWIDGNLAAEQRRVLPRGVVVAGLDPVAADQVFRHGE
jgi:hypothetical protein